VKTLFRTAPRSESAIVRASTTLVIAALIAGTANFAKELVVARKFGAGRDLDAYLVAFTIVLFVPVILGFVLQGTFVTAVVRQAELLGGAPSTFVRTVMTASFGMLAVAAATILLALPVFIDILAPGYSVGARAETRLLAVELIPLVLLLGLSYVLSSALNAMKSFALPAVAQMLPAVGAIITILTLGACVGNA
jgi:putative peptidoglycan lipid II flippase